MSFNRYRAQTLCESLFGCTDFENFHNLHHSVIETFVLDYSAAGGLSSSLQEDARDLYFKGCQSLAESLTSFQNRLYSWAVIKAYYATFYMIKADFALRDFALIRHKCIYYLQAKDGATPQTKGRSSANRANYAGDHKSALNYYKDLFSNSDILLSQEIDGLSSYQWLMKKREQVNYQERSFNEPSRPDFLEYIDIRVSNGEFTNLINEIENDSSYTLTFQPEYAAIAIPFKRASLTKKNFLDHGITAMLSQAQIDHLSSSFPLAFY